MSQVNGIPLAQAGIFKVRPFQWSVVQSERSQSVGIAIGFIVDYGLDGEEWVSWKESDIHVVYGTWWVIGREGNVNQTAVDQLRDAIGWDGNLTKVAGDPPEAEVQVTVKEESYEKDGKTKTSFKATWMNPGDFKPQPFGEDAEGVKALQNRFGSLLRAAAAGAAKTPSKPAASKPASKSAPPARSGKTAPNPISGEPVAIDKLGGE